MIEKVTIDGCFQILRTCFLLDSWTYFVIPDDRGSGKCRERISTLIGSIFSNLDNPMVSVDMRRRRCLSTCRGNFSGLGCPAAPGHCPQRVDEGETA